MGLIRGTSVTSLDESSFLPVEEYQTNFPFIIRGKNCDQWTDIIHKKSQKACDYVPQYAHLLRPLVPSNLPRPGCRGELQMIKKWIIKCISERGLSSAWFPDFYTLTEEKLETYVGLHCNFGVQLSLQQAITLFFQIPSFSSVHSKPMNPSHMSPSLHFFHFKMSSLFAGNDVCNNKAINKALCKIH